MKKKLIISAVIIFGVPVLIIGAILIYNCVVALIPDYVNDRYIEKGYSDSDGRVFAGKDYDLFYYYKYKSMPELNEKYEKVTDDNIDHLNTAMKGYGLFNQEEPYIQNTDKKVSVGDYYIVTYYKDGKEVEYERDNCSIYFYDTESNTLYHIYYVW